MQPIAQAWLEVPACLVPLEVVTLAVLVCLEVQVQVQLEVRVAWVPAMVAWVEVQGARSKL
ncbi:MAG TPA: hypothetical protein VIK56_10105 [Rhodoferax sp.]